MKKIEKVIAEKSEYKKDMTRIKDQIDFTIYEKEKKQRTPKWCFAFAAVLPFLLLIPLLNQGSSRPITSNTTSNIDSATNSSTFPNPPHPGTKEALEFLSVQNEDEITFAYEKNASFVEEDLSIVKKNKVHRSEKVSKDDYTLDTSSFKKGEVGKYPISFYLNDNEEIKGTYEVEVIDEVIVDIALKKARTVYYQGESILKEDIVLEKIYESGNRKEAHINEYKIDTSSFDSSKEGTYSIQVELLTNAAFHLSYEVEVKNIAELDLTGKYGYVETYAGVGEPSEYAFEILDNQLIPYYSEIVMRGNLRIEIVEDEILVYAENYTQHITYIPQERTLVVSGIAGDPDMPCFPLLGQDIFISLEGDYVDSPKTLYIAKNGYLSSATLDYISYYYGGVYLDETLLQQVTSSTLFENDTTLYTGFLPFEVDESTTFLGAWYNKRNEWEFALTSDIAYLGNAVDPVSYQVQKTEIGLFVWIKDYAYIKYLYNAENDYFEIWGPEGLCYGLLARVDEEKQCKVTLHMEYGSYKSYVLEKGNSFPLVQVENDMINYLTIPSYHEEKIYKDVTFENVRLSSNYMSDFDDIYYGTLDDYWMIQYTYSTNSNSIYHYSISHYVNYTLVERSGVYFASYDDKEDVIILGLEEGERKIAVTKPSNQLIVDEVAYYRNKQIFSFFEENDISILGAYFSQEGQEMRIQENGLLSKITYKDNGNYWSTGWFLHVTSIEENQITFQYAAYEDKEGLQSLTLTLEKVDGIWQFTYQGVLYVKGEN